MSPKTEIQQTVFHRMRKFLLDYIVFPDETYADICALWAMGTHVYRRFDSFGYLVITASTRRAGKSVLAELVAMISHDAKMGSGLTPSVMRDYIAQGKSVFFDEAETLNSEASSQMRMYLNIGYRQGQMIPVRVGVDQIVERPAYGPKCFVLIGDVNDTLRDRSINIELRRIAQPPKVYRYRTAKIEADLIQGATDPDNGDSDLTNSIDTGYHDELYDAFDVPILRSREGEVWSAIFSLAKVFCPERLDAIIACAVDLASAKMTTEKRVFSEIRATEEEKAANDSFRTLALSDLASVFKSNEKRIFTDDAIERMKAIPTSPWRTYKGEGLTPMMLYYLLDAFGVNTKDIKAYEKVSGHRKQIVRRGYQRADVEAGIKRMGEK